MVMVRIVRIILGLRLVLNVNRVRVRLRVMVRVSVSVNMVTVRMGTEFSACRVYLSVMDRK